jgi:hypothetical protein
VLCCLPQELLSAGLAPTADRRVFDELITMVSVSALAPGVSDGLEGIVRNECEVI